MRRNLFILVTIALLPVNHTFAQCAQTASIYSFNYGGHHYEIVKELKIWTDAAACAVERGGYLVRIDNAAENAQLMTSINAAGIAATYHPVTDGGGASYIWTGGSDKNTEGSWLWDGDNNNIGTNFWTGQGTAGSGGGAAIAGAYVNWGCNTYCEPDNYFYIHDQDALGFALNTWPYGSATQWNDIDMMNTLYYIIEFDNTGINDTKGSNNPDVFPNPAKDYIQINGLQPNIQHAEISIIAVDGKVVIHQIPKTQKIDISSLSFGNYIVKIKSENESFFCRFIKQ
ncbi:MAG: T9SS type A sorting domain-containing protein [Bacteroidota bacterium]